MSEEPWNLTEAQRRQFREAHSEAKRKEMAARALPVIDYDAFSALIPGLEVIHEDGRLIYAYGISAGSAVEVEQHDGMAVVLLRHWTDGRIDGQTERGRFPADATADIAACARLAIEEAGQ